MKLTEGEYELHHVDAPGVQEFMKVAEYRSKFVFAFGGNGERFIRSYVYFLNSEDNLAFKIRYGR